MRTLIPFLLSIGCALSAPAWKAELSPVKPGHHPALTSSTLDFTLSWKGMLKAGTLRISFGLRKIDRISHALVPYKKLKKPVTLWLSNDADRIPIELRASAYIGDVRAVLTHFSKAP